MNSLLLTGDGSHTLHSQAFDVDYHSVHGAVQESEHVFLRAGLQPLLDSGATSVRILEMGFGTGLNALLVRLQAHRHPEVSFHYETFEQYPVSATVVAALNYPQQLGVPARQFTELHDCGWGAPQRLDDNFTLVKHHADYQATPPPYPTGTFDVVFYDAFAPASQPELWSAGAMVVNWEALRQEGALVTYCAQGQFKRNLKTVGFAVEGIPGPPGKREMTRATKT